MIIRKIDKGVYFEHAGIWYNRVDVEVEVIEANGNRFGAKARDYIIWKQIHFALIKQWLFAISLCLRKELFLILSIMEKNESE